MQFRTASVLSLRVLVACWCVLSTAGVRAQSDLDAFMKQVLATRDENWKKLQQYILDERELVEVRGPGHIPLWGERKDYTWYIRDGFFIRSPVKVNGVSIGDSERRKAEADYLHRQQEREKRRERGQNGGAVILTPAPVIELPAGNEPQDDLLNVDGLLKQTRQPEFVSSAYFLRFKFDEGKYALVGRETIDGRETLKIEYYPTKLFGGTDRRRNERRQPDSKDKARDQEFQRLMNKVSLVTLWVEPKAHQIVKYTFDNIAFDFLPVQWLVHIDDVKASMTMGQPFPDVWLPNTLDLTIAMTIAVGQFDMRYGINYLGYRRADVTSKVGIPKDR